MQEQDVIKMLATEDFEVDALGRVVIHNIEILNAIHGAASPNQIDPMNGFCHNSRCS